MASRTAYVGTESVGDVLTKTNFDKLPGGLIGYAIVTANQGSITTLADLNSLTVTVTANTSRIFRLSGYGVLSGTATAGVDFYIRESTTTLVDTTFSLAGAGQFGTPALSCIISPSGGSHTYKLSAAFNAGTGTLNASATQPAYIAVEDLGPAF